MRCGETDFLRPHQWVPDEQEPDEDGYVEYEVCGRHKGHRIHQDKD